MHRCIGPGGAGGPGRRPPTTARRRRTSPPASGPFDRPAVPLRRIDAHCARVALVVRAVMQPALDGLPGGIADLHEVDFTSGRPVFFSVWPQQQQAVIVRTRRRRLDAGFPAAVQLPWEPGHAARVPPLGITGQGQPAVGDGNRCRRAPAVAVVAGSVVDRPLIERSRVGEVVDTVGRAPPVCGGRSVGAVAVAGLCTGDRTQQRRGTNGECEDADRHAGHRHHHTSGSRNGGRHVLPWSRPVGTASLPSYWTDRLGRST